MKELIMLATEYAENSSGNSIPENKAISPELAGKRIYDAPLFGFAAADDKIFESFKSQDAIGAHYIAPTEWLPSAKTVISFFLPFTKEVSDSNADNFNEPSSLWLHGRIEGQEFLGSLTDYIISTIEAAGFETIAPTQDARFRSNEDTICDIPFFTSNWSERHAAFASGLGTFGLSRGIITEKGMSGRLGSVLTTAVFPVTERKYTGVYDYCTYCGACVKHCPVKAISLERGKDHVPCSKFISDTRKKYNPRYGCGKCQVKTPCTHGIPRKNAAV